MHPPDDPSPNSLRYFAAGVLCVAVVLGGYFVQINAQVDRQREEAAERLALCRQVERVASAATPTGVERRDSCKQLIEHSANSAASQSPITLFYTWIYRR